MPKGRPWPQCGHLRKRAQQSGKGKVKLCDHCAHQQGKQRKVNIVHVINCKGEMNLVSQQEV